MNITEVEQLRRDTPGCANRIHLNNAGASLPSRAVVDAVIDHLRLEEAIGPYEAAEEHAHEEIAFAASAAELIGAAPSEIAFCDSATRAWNLIAYSLDLGPGDKILTSAIDFGGGLLALQHVAERTGAELVIGPSDPSGRIDLEKLDDSHLAGTRVIAVTHVAAHSGAANPVVALGEIARRIGAIYIVDASQSVGSLVVDVAAIGCDALTTTGRKWLRGPRGTGFLYVSSSLARMLDPISVDLATATYDPTPKRPGASRLVFRDDARKFEVWERNTAAMIGLERAMSSLLQIGVARVQDRVLGLAEQLASGLADISGVNVWSPTSIESGVVGFTMGALDAAEVKERCVMEGINLSVMMSRAAPHDFLRRDQKAVVRVGPHYFNLASEVDRLLSTIDAAAAGT